MRAVGEGRWREHWQDPAHRAVGIQHVSSAPKAWAEASKTMLSWGETGWAGRVLDPDSPRSGVRTCGTCGTCGHRWYLRYLWYLWSPVVPVLPVVPVVPVVTTGNTGTTDDHMYHRYHKYHRCHRYHRWGTAVCSANQETWKQGGRAVCWIPTALCAGLVKISILH